jgi:hypothetical protein
MLANARSPGSRQGLRRRRALSRQIREISDGITEMDRPAGTDDISIAAATPDEEWPAT